MGVSKKTEQRKDQPIQFLEGSSCLRFSGAVGDDLFYWLPTITSLNDSTYQGGIFFLPSTLLTGSSSKPPKFISLIQSNDSIYLDTLQFRWSPTLTVSKFSYLSVLCSAANSYDPLVTGIVHTHKADGEDQVPSSGCLCIMASPNSPKWFNRLAGVDTEMCCANASEVFQGNVVQEKPPRQSPLPQTLNWQLFA